MTVCKECPECGNSFRDNTKPKNKITCSVTCADKYRKRRQRIEYRKRNPKPITIGREESMRLACLRRRARTQNLPDNLTHRQRDIMLKKFRYTCALTGSKTYHLDHVIPIAVGHVGTTFGNIIPLRPDLNVSKHANNVFEWFDRVQERFDLCSDKFAQAIVYLAEVNDMTTEEYREYVYWCHDNPREFDEEQDGKATG